MTSVAHPTSRTGIVLSTMTTVPDLRAVLRNARLLGIAEATAFDAWVTLTTGDAAGLVLSARLAAGKDAVAEEIARRGNFGPTDIHRTSDPIRYELNAIIDLVRVSADEHDARRGVEAMGITSEPARILVRAITQELDTGRQLRAEMRTDLARFLLVYLADEGRRSVDPDYWVPRFFAPMLESLARGHSATLTGSRYPNEVIPAQAFGLYVVRLEVSRAVQLERLAQRDGIVHDESILSNPNETALDRFAGFNLVLDNDGPILPTVETIEEHLESHKVGLTD